MVLGHSGCGAVKTTLQMLRAPADLPGRLWSVVDGLTPGVRPALAEPDPALAMAAAVAGNVRHTAARLAEAPPVIAAAVQGGRVRVVGAVYDLATGRVALVG